MRGENGNGTDAEGGHNLDMAIAADLVEQGNLIAALAVAIGHGKR